MIAPSFSLSFGPTASPLTDKDALTALAGILGTILTLLGTTVAIVSFSGSRQEHLSNRIRLLANEYRESPPRGAAKGAPEYAFCIRKEHINKQLNLFKKRLGRCIFGHICLYIALGTEIVISLSAIWIFAAITAVKLHNLIAYLSLVFVIIFAQPFWLVIWAVRLNIVEYCDSNQTMGEELLDIPSCSGAIPAWHERIDASKLPALVNRLIYMYFGWWGAKKLDDSSRKRKKKQHFRITDDNACSLRVRYAGQRTSILVVFNR